MAEKKWSKDVDIKEGALEKIGWPSASAIANAVASGKVDYKTAISRLNYLANITKDEATKRKARSIIISLQKRFKKEKSQPKK